MNSKNKTVTFILDLTQEGIIMVILHMACVKKQNSNFYFRFNSRRHNYGNITHGLCGAVFVWTK